jgi:GcrA cell cycle regulator
MAVLWTEADKSALRELWASGKPASEIGLLLHYSANAVIGKAHRMDLDARPSPIKGRQDAAVLRERHERAVLLAEGGYKPYQIKNATGVSFETAQRIVRRTRPVAAADPPPAPPMPAPEPPPPVPVVREPEFDPREYVFVARPRQPPRPVSICCWPIGEPGTRTFRFCDGPLVTGKSYCDEHDKLAHVHVRVRVA